MTSIVESIITRTITQKQPRSNQMFEIVERACACGQATQHTDVYVSLNLSVLIAFRYLNQLKKNIEELIYFFRQVKHKERYAHLTTLRVSIKSALTCGEQFRRCFTNKRTFLADHTPFYSFLRAISCVIFIFMHVSCMYLYVCTARCLCIYIICIVYVCTHQHLCVQIAHIQAALGISVRKIRRRDSQTTC